MKTLKRSLVIGLLALVCCQTCISEIHASPIFVAPQTEMISVSWEQAMAVLKKALPSFQEVTNITFSGLVDRYELALCTITDLGNGSYLVEDGGIGIQIVIDEA